MYRPCTSLSKVNLYITVLGGDFWKYLNGEFVFYVTIKIHYSFNVCRITFSQEDVHLQSFTEQYLIVNKTVQRKLSKIQDTNPPPYTCTPKAYCILDICTVWIDHNPLSVNYPKCTLRLIHTERYLRSSPPVNIILHEFSVIWFKYLKMD